MYRLISAAPVLTPARCALP